MKTKITGHLLDLKGLQSFANDDEGWSETDNLLIIYNNDKELWDVVDLRGERKTVIASITFWEEFLELYGKVNGKVFRESTFKPTLHSLLNLENDK